MGGGTSRHIMSPPTYEAQQGRSPSRLNDVADMVVDLFNERGGKDRPNGSRMDMVSKLLK